MPTRGRVELAKQSIASLGKGDFEVLLAIDWDDEESVKELTNIGHESLTISERFGYGRLHCYYNWLASEANGDWLMLWNDDAIMETPDWTDIISKYDHTIPQVLNVWNENGDNLFPLISRKWYEIVGHYSRNPHVDSWVQLIGQRLGIQVYVPGIKIAHQGEDLHDQTHKEVKEIVRETSAAFRRMERERIEDANKIKEWYEANHKM